ncbi:MAG: diaminopimelate epimerase [Prevotella sp.]|nr:diaminopimelate epimerase [Prevotella sp.]
MTTNIKFTKMHGAGNDYIYVNTLLYNIPDPTKASIAWSAPHTGIGSDGLVLIDKAKIPEADFSMRIFNADGSEAMMCGNASRCIGKYLFEKGITDKTEIKLLTLSGIKILKLTLDHKGEKVESVTVDMLEPVLNDKKQMASEDGSMKDGLVDVIDREFRGTFVSMGNPHFVIFVDNVDEIDVARYGKALEFDSLFPERCNIEFAQILDNGKIRTRVWERGSGITMACGTGACATAVAAAITGRATRKSEIVMDGGTLHIEWNEADNHVYLSGPAAFAFEGEVALPQ